MRDMRIVGVLVLVLGSAVLGAEVMMIWLADEVSGRVRMYLTLAERYGWFILPLAVVAAFAGCFWIFRRRAVVLV